jgi:hypothetical protein
MNISDPMFLGEGSYMAFQPSYIKRQIQIQLQIKPNTSEGLLFYVAQRLHSHSGDFLALTFNNKRVELRVDVGSGVNTIKNMAEVSNPGELLMYSLFQDTLLESVQYTNPLILKYVTTGIRFDHW